MNLVTVWNTASLESAPAQAPSPYQIGTTAAPALVVTNNSPYTIQIMQQGQQVNEVPGNSQLTFPTLPELSLQLDTSHPSIYMPIAPVVNLTFLDQAAAYGLVPLSPDTATQVTGDVSASISGPVSAQINGPVELAPDTSVNANIQNSSLNVTGSVNANITNANLNATVSGSVEATIKNANLNVQVINDGTQSIPVTGNVTATFAAGSSVNATITGTPTVNLAAGTSIQATIANSQVPVTISGTPTVNAVIQNASIPVTGDVTITAAQAVPIKNDTGGVIQVGGTMDVNVQNASLPVTGDVNITAAQAVPIKNETGGTVQVGGTVNANIQNSTLPVTISGTPTINANIQNSSIAVTGTVTANLPAGTAVNATITNSTVPVTVSGTPTVNATIQNSSLPVTISGTPAVNANITNSNLTVALASGTSVQATINGTPTVNLASGTSVNVSTGSVNIANTPGVNVQQMPSAPGSGYANETTLTANGANHVWQFLPNNIVTQLMAFTFSLTGGKASTSYTLNVSFQKKYASGDSSDATQGPWSLTISTDATGAFPEQLIYIPYNFGLSIIANQATFSLSGDTSTTIKLFFTVNAEYKPMPWSMTRTYSIYKPAANTWINTGLPLQYLTQVILLIGGLTSGAGTGIMDMRADTSSSDIFSIIFQTQTGQVTQYQINLTNPYNYTNFASSTLKFLTQGSTQLINLLSINAMYQIYQGEIFG